MTSENRDKEVPQEVPVQSNLSIQGGVDESIVILGDRNMVNQGPSYYTTNVFSPIQVEPATSTPSQPLSKQEYRRRQVLVDNVKHYWIEGVLKRSLHNQVLIELGLEERNQTVASPLKGIGEFPDEPNQTLPEGTQVTDVFDGLGAGRTLLILGEPGAGKTVTLLKLAQSLLLRIGDDLSQPIPVVLNLSSWAERHQPIAEWLVQELYETFQVSKSLGTTWVEEEQLVLCLDGLDEVDATYRNECVAALNRFVQKHGLTEIIICSRIKDYEALYEKLRLRSAIYVQPLTTKQVNHYLLQAGEQLSSLRKMLQSNPEMMEFASSPLILSIMSLVYQGCNSDSLPLLENARVFRQQLFELYIRRMLKRRGTTHLYPDTQSIRWLAWTARKMVETSKTIFLIEQVQPSWLQSGSRRLRYRIEGAITYGLFVGLVWSIYVLVARVAIRITAYQLIYIPMNEYEPLPIFVRGSLVALIAIAVAITLGEIRPVETIGWSSDEAKKGFQKGADVGVAVGLLVGLVSSIVILLSLDIGVESFNDIYRSIDSGSRLPAPLLVGIVGGVSFRLIRKLNDIFNMRYGRKRNLGALKSMHTTLTFTLIISFFVLLPLSVLPGELWIISWIAYGLGGSLIGSLIGKLTADILHIITRCLVTYTTVEINVSSRIIQHAQTFALIYGLSSGALYFWIYRLNSELAAKLLTEFVVCIYLTLWSSLLYIPVTGIVIGLFAGFRSPRMRKSLKPNQAIWKSGQNAVIVALLSSFSVGLTVGLGSSLTDRDTPFSNELIVGVSDGLAAGSIALLLCGLIFGGSACLRHFSLRLTLYRIGCAPWNYTRFLDYATERLFLQKVGGGYIFIHRMLLEHFAQMEMEQNRKEKSE